jgi:hypothetical protein
MSSLAAEIGGIEGRRQWGPELDRRALSSTALTRGNLHTIVANPRQKKCAKKSVGCLTSSDEAAELSAGSASHYSMWRAMLMQFTRSPPGGR